MCHAAPRIEYDATKLGEAIAAYAGRVARTDDPKAHQQAAQTLQAHLKQARVKA